MDTSSIRDWGELVALLIALGTVGSAVWKYVIKPIVKWGQGITEMRLKVESIWSQLQPNGGNSLFDRVARLAELGERIETRQRISEQVDKQMFAALAIGVFWADVRGRCTDVSRTYCRITGRTAEEMQGLNWTTYVHADDQEGVIEEWRSCVAETRQFERVYRFIRPDGLVQRVHARAGILLDRAGSSAGWFGTIDKVGEPAIDK